MKKLLIVSVLTCLVSPQVYATQVWPLTDLVCHEVSESGPSSSHLFVSVSKPKASVSNIKVFGFDQDNQNIDVEEQSKLVSQEQRKKNPQTAPLGDIDVYELDVITASGELSAERLILFRITTTPPNGSFAGTYVDKQGSVHDLSCKPDENTCLTGNCN